MLVNEMKTLFKLILLLYQQFMRQVDLEANFSSLVLQSSWL